MNPNEISAIQNDQQLHYIDEQSLKNSQFSSKQLDFSEMQQIQYIIHESTLHPNIFYSRKNMKLLLEERSCVCQHLKLKPTKNKTNKEYEELNRENAFKLLKKVFKDSPSAVDQNGIVHISDCLAMYCFFSSDGRFVPLCKACNCSVYAIIRDNNCKVICCNTKCKIKILGQHTESEKSQKFNSMKSIEKSETMSKISSKSGSSKKSFCQRAYTKEELELIKKTTNKIIYN